MSKHPRSIRTFLALAALGAVPLTLALAPHDRGRTYEVTVTNLTRGQVLSPLLAATHDDSVHLFEIGAPAAPELVLLAEDGDNGPLAAFLEADSGVGSVALGAGLLPPGHSETLTVHTGGRRDRLSLAGMLVSTNDTFAALDGVRIEDGLTVLGHAYDAGSEANSEDCAFIPGPPCGNGGVRDTAGAEGFVHVGNGIHGQGSLDPAEFDWRGPVVRVTVRRVRDGD
jgi:hypothetical protein